MSFASSRTNLRPGGSRWSDWLACAAMAGITVAAYWPTLGAEFVNWDDPQNLTQNYFYRGLSAARLRVMFTTFYMGVWQPLGWISYAILYQTNRLEPAAYHAVNLAIHTANALLFFAVARRLLNHWRPAEDRAARRPTRAAAFIAAIIFAVHPLRVEAVAWATCQPYLLAGTFLLISVWAWLRSVAARGGGGRGAWLALSLLAYACSLMSKSIGVPLPVVLIVLDVYPLNRWRSRGAWLEKAPYLVMAGVTAIIASFATRGNAPLAQELGPLDRAAIAAYGSIFYIHRTFVPDGLIPFNRIPRPMDPFAWRFVLSAAGVVGVSLLAWVMRRRIPAVAAAWVAYLAILAPVLGLVQHGAQLTADRYSYLSVMPLALLIGAVMARATSSGRRRFDFGVFAGLVLAAPLAVLTSDQTHVWDDSESLWRHTIAVDPQSSMAHGNLATELKLAGRLDESLVEFTRAVELDERHDAAWTGLGLLHLDRNDVAHAEQCFQRALDVDKKNVDAMLGLARVQLQSTRRDDARVTLRSAAAVVSMVEACVRVADLLQKAELPEEAIEQYRRAVGTAPDLEYARTKLATLLALTAGENRERLSEAIEHMGQATLLRRDNHSAHANLCAMLTLRARLGPETAESDRAQAIAQGMRAIQIKPDYALGHYHLAGALAAAGRDQDAHQHNQIARELAERSGDSRIAARADARRRQRPADWRE